MAPRTHTHHPNGEGPVCRFPTKRECDAFFREYQANKKAEFEAEQARREEERKLEQVRKFDEFIASEARRAAEVTTWERPSTSPNSTSKSSSKMTTPSPTKKEPDGLSAPLPQPVARATPSVRVIRIPRPSSSH